MSGGSSAPDGLAGQVEEVVDQAAEASAKVQRHPLYRSLVVLGLCCYGVVHLLLALLALKVMRGVPTDASNQGTLTTIAHLPLGRVLVGVLGLGMAALAVWMVLEAAFGYPWLEGRQRLVRRISCTGRAIAYGSISWLSWSLMASGRVVGSDADAQQQARGLLALPGGRVIAVLVAIGIAIAAGDQVQRGVRQRFVRYDLQSPLPGWAVKLGTVGWVAKGLSLAIVAVLFATAAWHHDPKDAGGLDRALTTLSHTPVGMAALGFIVFGFTCFGLYCFVWAPHARHDASPDKDPR